MAAPSLSASGIMISINFSLISSARPPETMILAAVSSGRSFFAISLPTGGVRTGGDCSHSFHRGGAPSGDSGVKAGGAHSEHLDTLCSAPWQSRCCVNQTLKGVKTFNFGDIRIPPTSSLAEDCARRFCHWRSEANIMWEYLLLPWSTPEQPDVWPYRWQNPVPSA